VGPADLRRVLSFLEPETDPALLVGSGTYDDAGVFRLSADLALIQTVDFFPPVVDDPRTFGAISAANSLSDVYAMGGRPVTALVICCVPNGFAPEILGEILAGGQQMAHRAGVPIVGGHTVKDPELKYGLAVTGLVHPDRIITNAGARVGDYLYLTKPLGTGVITTALKNQACPPEVLEPAVAGMQRLNAAASEAMIEAGAHAGTDITGFGLLGHAHALAQASGVALEFDVGKVPLLPGAREAVAEGHVPGGLVANRAYLEEWVQVESGVGSSHELLYDPQTSGGLLIVVAAEDTLQLSDALQRRNEPVYPVGRVVEGRAGRIRLRP
jgi:selenide, water dikinase